MPRPFVISMYSFKGGAGRTVCTANLAPRLAAVFDATSNKPILMLDLDLDSAGLTILLSEHHVPRATNWNAADFLADQFNLGVDKQAEKFEREGMVDVTAALGLSDRPGALRLLAGAQTERQVSVDITGFGANQAMDSLFRFAEKRGIPVILIDSASGVQPTAVLSHHVSDVVVYCCRITLQFVMGTKTHLELLIRGCEARNRRPPRILLLPVAVPEVSPRWQDTFEFRLDELRQTCVNLRGRADVEIVEPAVNEVDAFKWEESVLDSHASHPDEALAAQAFEALAARIFNMTRKATAANRK